MKLKMWTLVGVLEVGAGFIKSYYRTVRIWKKKKKERKGQAPESKTGFQDRKGAH